MLSYIYLHKSLFKSLIISLGKFFLSGNSHSNASTYLKVLDLKLLSQRLFPCTHSPTIYVYPINLLLNLINLLPVFH